MRLVLPLIAVVSLVPLGGCSSMAGYGDEKKPAPAAPAPEVQVPVQSVRSIEIGRTRDGFLITAYGVAQGLGYAQPELRPRRDGAPGIDGYIEYDFVASEPPAGFGLPEGTAQARALRADLPVERRRTARGGWHPRAGRERRRAARLRPARAGEAAAPLSRAGSATTWIATSS